MPIYGEQKVITVEPSCPLCGSNTATYLGFISINWDTGFNVEGVKCVRCGTIRQKLAAWCPDGMEKWAKYHPGRREIRNGKVIREWAGELKPI